MPCPSCGAADQDGATVCPACGRSAWPFERRRYSRLGISVDVVLQRTGPDGAVLSERPDTP